MGCASNQNQDGFTLVEISIVMIIIGLLIGGILSGRQLIETMRINTVVQQLNGIQAAALSFKDIYGTFPGDLRNPASRLINCTALPCSRTGNGNRRVESVNTDATTYMAGEGFSFWNHLQTSEIISFKMTGENDINFGRGQPKTPIFNGVSYGTTPFNPYPAPLPAGAPVWNGYLQLGTQVADTMVNAVFRSCRILARIDQKMDDGNAYAPSGRVYGRGCQDFGPTQTQGYNISYSGGLLSFDLKGF
jgi:prepilin-type N-terminal cleavage/methylation domain-containing protein